MCVTGALRKDILLLIREEQCECLKLPKGKIIISRGKGVINCEVLFYQRNRNCKLEISKRHGQRQFRPAEDYS